ncbi:ribonucleotide-diphosphate reductase subunit beta [bacterium]|jgi:ribonucleoside-diphosphate reductase beta chain|nr:ribonucleotide-diphosphate reductase subunit beta [bacterium]
MSESVSKRELFQNEFGESTMSNIELINKRRVINGVDDGLMQVSPLKHPWAYEIFENMIKNNWVPQEVPMQKDVEQWNDPKGLTDQERNVYKKSLAFVSNLDGLQTNNLACNIIRHITSPEVVLGIVRQTYEEALHVQSYATMIEALALDPEDVYGLYRKDQDLFEKNKQVLAAVSKISDPTFQTGTLKNDQMFLEACVGNIILEGIYFYSAFLTFYVLKRNNKMPGSAEMIQFINRDEDVHLQLFIKITNAIKEEQPELWTPEFQAQIVQNVKDGVELEYSWGASCMGEGILGLTPNSLKEYLQFIGDMRLIAIGLPKVWNSKNPFPWIDEYTQGSMIEVNFFEGTVKEYQTGSLEW